MDDLILGLGESSQNVFSWECEFSRNEKLVSESYRFLLGGQDLIESDSALLENRLSLGWRFEGDLGKE